MTEDNNLFDMTEDDTVRRRVDCMGELKDSSLFANNGY